MGGNIPIVSKRTHLQGGGMKNLFPTVLLLLLASVICLICGYAMGQNSLNGNISIQDTENVQKISGVSSISIYNWRGDWEIQFDLQTKCGKIRIKSGNHPTLKEAIEFAKVGASCYDSCGAK